MEFENLLRPGRINTMQLRNRLLAGPMERAMANLDGTLTPRYVDYVRERAAGGAALITIESTYVHPRGKGNPYQVGAHDDAIIPAMRRMTSAVHAEGGKLALELYYAGNQGSTTASYRQPLAPSTVPCTFLAPVPIPRAMTTDDIRWVVGMFADAARRCLDAEVDMVHLHGAHGYLLSQFLSPHSNQRTDHYGGSLENRARLPLEILAAVRAVVGPDYPVAYRHTAVEFVPGGLELEESVRFAEMLADNGIDLIDISAGVYESIDQIFHGPEMPKGAFVPFAAEIKKAVGDRVPVSVAQRLNDPVFADSVLAEHNLDYISLTRAWHADPHLARKLQRGTPEQILPCIGCNTCLNMTVARVPSGCAANPHSTFEITRRIQPAQAPRRVLVVGGGVAGMHAARILARQGNEVTLCEASSAVGGQITYARRITPDFGELTDWLARELDEHGVTVETGTEVDVAYIEQADPDVAIIATGAGAGMLWADQDRVTVPVLDLFTAMDREPGSWDGPVAVVGGDFTSCRLAQYLACQGVEVHVIEPNSAFATDKASPVSNILVMQLSENPRIHWHPETTAELVIGDEVELQTGGQTSRLTVGAVVIGGRTPRNGLHQQLQNSGWTGELHLIGDAVAPREVYTASFEAADVAGRIRDAAPRPAIV